MHVYTRVTIKSLLISELVTSDKKCKLVEARQKMCMKKEHYFTECVVSDLLY